VEKTIKLILIVLFFVLGCGSPWVMTEAWPPDERDERYNSQPEEIRALIDLHKIAYGWTKEQVLLSVGEPSETKDIDLGDSSEAVLWIYHFRGTDTRLKFNSQGILVRGGAMESRFMKSD
jgi:hypothetical protein